MGTLQRADFPTVWLDPHSAREAVAYSDLPATTRQVVNAIADYADNKTGKAFPTLATLARRTGLSPYTISKHTGLAMQAGYLWKVQRFNSSIIYRLSAPSDAVILTERKNGRRARAIGAVRKRDELLELEDGELESLNDPGQPEPTPAPKPRESKPQEPQAEATAEAVDLKSLNLDELKALTLKTPAGSPLYEAIKQERMGRAKQRAEAA